MFEVFYLTKLSLPRSPIIICFTVSVVQIKTKTAFQIEYFDLKSRCPFY